MALWSDVGVRVALGASDALGLLANSVLSTAAVGESAGSVRPGTTGTGWGPIHRWYRTSTRKERNTARSTRRSMIRQAPRVREE